MPVNALAKELRAVMADALFTHSQAELFAGLTDRLAAAPAARTVDAVTNSTASEWLATAVDAATGQWTELAQCLLEATPLIPWLRSYENLEPSTGLDAFQPHYTFQLLAGPELRGYEPPILCEDMLVGFSLQEPNVSYPPHHHYPAEIYGVISGHLDWQVGDTWTAVGPGDVIVHREHESHAMRTRDEPVLTWVAWPTTSDSHVYMPSLDPPDMRMDAQIYQLPDV